MKNQKELIRKLQLLKSIQPQPVVLNTIKKDVFMRLHIYYNEEDNTFFDQFMSTINLAFKSRLNTAYGVALGVIILIFIFTFSPFLQNKLHTISTYLRIALTQNQYKKASIALADSQYTYGDFKSINDNASKDISQSLSLANKELSLLKLKGEKGKYTAQQCHALYRTYLLYLEKISNTLPANQKSATLLKTQIFSYEELAEKKLHMYHDL